MNSILQTNKECYVCKTTLNLHSHHCLYGVSNRANAEKYGLKVWLCGPHHNMSDEGVHFNKPLDLHLKKISQKAFENTYGSRAEFIGIFGKNYL